MSALEPIQILIYGEWREVGSGIYVPPDPDPDPPPPPPPDWQQAWDSDDEPTLSAWYDAHAGIEGLGAEIGDLDVVTGGLTTSTNGQVLEGLAFLDGNLPQINHSNVTVRGCYFDVGARAMGGFGFGFTDAGLSDVRFEHCTFLDSYTGPPADGLRLNWFYGLSGVLPGFTISHCKWPWENASTLCIRLQGCSGTPMAPIVIEYNRVSRWRPDPEGRTNIIHWLTNSPGAEVRHWRLNRNMFYGQFPIYGRTGNNGAWSPGDGPNIATIGNFEWVENVFNTNNRIRTGQNVVSDWTNNVGGDREIIVWPWPDRLNDFGGPLQNTLFKDNRIGRWSYPHGSNSQVHAFLDFNLTHGAGNVFEGTEMLGWGNTPLPGGTSTPDPAVDGQRSDWAYIGNQAELGTPAAAAHQGWVRT